MLRLKLNDRYIKSTIVFESYGDSAMLSYFGEPTLPVGAQYELAGLKWRVNKVIKSDYNPQVVNVYLDRLEA